MLLPVQPYRAEFGQCRAYGRGAHAALGQIHTDTAHGQRAQIAVVHGALNFQGQSLGIGQQTEVAHGAHGRDQLRHDRTCGLQQQAVLVLGVAQRVRSDGLELHCLSGMTALRHAALPRAPEPGARPDGTSAWDESIASNCCLAWASREWRAPGWAAACVDVARLAGDMRTPDSVSF